MPLADFSLKVDFNPGFAWVTAKVSRIFAPAELAVFALANTAQTTSASPCCRYRSTGIPKILELLCLKSPFAQNLPAAFYSIILFSKIGDVSVY
jgi:hypothetical protein